MKKSQLLDIVRVLTLFAVSCSANSAIIAGDDTSFTDRDQSYVPTLTVSPSSFTGAALTLDVLGDTGKTQPAVNFNFFVDSTSPKSLHTDSQINLWLILIVSAVFGVLSEISNRRSSSR